MSADDVGVSCAASSSTSIVRLAAVTPRRRCVGAGKHATRRGHSGVKSFGMLKRPEPNSRLLVSPLCFVATLAAVAVVAGLTLLLLDVLPPELRLRRQLISATALLSIGLAYVWLQVLVKPRPKDLPRRLMVASAFILWGTDQLLASSPLAGDIGLARVSGPLRHPASPVGPYASISPNLVTRQSSRYRYHLSGYPSRTIQTSTPARRRSPSSRVLRGNDESLSQVRMLSEPLKGLFRGSQASSSHSVWNVSGLSMRW